MLTNPKMSSALVATFHTVRAEHVTSNTMVAKRIELDGVSVNGLMMQKLLRDTQNNDMLNAIKALSASVASLNSTTSLLTSQFTNLSGQVDAVAASQAEMIQAMQTISNQVTTIAQSVVENAQLIAEQNLYIMEHDDYIEKLKQTTYFVFPTTS